MKIVAIAAAVVLVVSCFLPWVFIDSKSLTLTGISALNFGKPAFLHFFLAAATIILLLLNKPISQKAALLFSALNLAWAVRNFLMISACYMGDCPERLSGIYIMLISSIAMLIGVVTMPAKVQANNTSKSEVA